MRNLLFTFLFGIISFVSTAQQKTTGAIPDVQALMKMSPAELQAYKEKMQKAASQQARQMASSANRKIDEMLLPDAEIRPPVLDSRRLKLLPSQPPSLVQLSDALIKSRQRLETLAPRVVLEEVKSITTQKNPAQQQSAAIAEFYADRPVQALLIAMQSVLLQPTEMVGWNNLAALYTMTGLEHKAIPILQQALVQMPANAILLNNIGQAYLGLGDLGTAENYLQQCLQQDPLHPEANRSMGMIRLFQQQSDAARAYFEKELEVAHRRSTLALLKRKGVKIDLNAIRKRRTGIPHQDFFTDIGLNKFKLPDLPTAAGQSVSWHNEHAAYLQSLQAEFYFWTNAGNITQEMREEEGRKTPGLYADLEAELNSDLGDTYAPLLGLIQEQDANHLEGLVADYTVKMTEAVCPAPPQVPGGGAELMKAYQQKCCDLRKPIADAYVAARNDFVTSRYAIVDARWKEYINAMIANVQLNPTAGNKKMVYEAVAQYFGFLLTTIQSAACFEDNPTECFDSGLTSEQAGEIIAASHQIDWNCPAWLNLELDVQVAKIKADCSKYALEAGAVLKGSYEHDFKTGTSTLSGGLGLKAKFFAGAGGAELKQMVYVSFDNNNQFSDFGLKGTAQVKIGDTPASIADGIAKVGGTIAGIEGGYTLGLNSGFNSAVKGKGIIADFVKIDQSL
jgi:tetratricopeptide (TPR) repeat protein